MMLWLSKRPPDDKSENLDGFHYYLAHQLHKTIGEVRAMPHAELVAWGAYFTAKAACESMADPR